MPVSGLFAVRYPPPIPWSLLYFRSLVRIEHSFPVPGLRLVGWPAPLTGFITQGNIWLSQVPRLPLWLHALLADPGGALIACRNAISTAAFRYPQNVGFYPRSPGSYSKTTMCTISGFSHTACSLAPSGFGLPLPGLPADFTIDTPVAGLTRGLHYWPAG
jgi:hypothetical protein